MSKLEEYLKKVQVSATTTLPALPAVQRVRSNESYLPAKLSKLLVGVTTVEQCVNLALTGEIDSIGALVRSSNAGQVESLIVLYFIELNAILGLKNPLNEVQIDFIAAELVANFKTLTMADVYIVLHRAKTGEYGEYYESLNPPKVLKWFTDYFDERCKVAENMHLQAAEIYKNSYMGSGIRASAQQTEQEHQKNIEFLKFKTEYDRNKDNEAMR